MFISRRGFLKFLLAAPAAVAVSSLSFAQPEITSGFSTLGSGVIELITPSFSLRAVECYVPPEYPEAEVSIHVLNSLIPKPVGFSHTLQLSCRLEGKDLAVVNSWLDVDWLNPKYHKHETGILKFDGVEVATLEDLFFTRIESQFTSWGSDIEKLSFNYSTVNVLNS